MAILFVAHIEKRICKLLLRRFPFYKVSVYSICYKKREADDSIIFVLQK